MHPIEPLKVQDVAELLISAEVPEDRFGELFKIGTRVSEPKKWSSLIFALFLHCALTLAFYAVGRPQPAYRHDRIEVQLIGSLGDSEGEGSCAPAAQTETGDNGSKAGEKEHCPPPAHEFVTSESPKEDEVLKKPAEHAVEKKKAPPVVPKKTRIAEKKKARQDIPPSKGEPETKPESNGVTGAASAGSNIAPVGPGTSSEAGSGASGLEAGSGGHGTGGGLGEVAFGSPNGPRFLHKVVPLYPDFARKQEMQGAVLLRVTIDEEGRVVNIEVVKKAGFGFDEAAVKAISVSSFIPAKNDGKSCSCKALLPIRFELKSSGMD